MSENLTHAQVREAVDRLVVEVGTRKGSFYLATFTIKDIIDRLGAKNTPNNQRYVGYVIKQWYKYQMSPGQSDSGPLVKVEVRSV